MTKERKRKYNFDFKLEKLDEDHIKIHYWNSRLNVELKPDDVHESTRKGFSLHNFMNTPSNSDIIEHLYLLDYKQIANALPNLIYHDFSVIDAEGDLYHDIILVFDSELYEISDNIKEAKEYVLNFHKSLKNFGDDLANIIIRSRRINMMK